jgi:hypothetical protein
MARARKRRQAQRQARQAKAKSNKENRYVIKVMNEVKQGRGYGSLGSREPKDVPSLFVGCKIS